MFKRFKSACLFHKYALVFLDYSKSAPHNGETVVSKMHFLPPRCDDDISVSMYRQSRMLITRELQ